jgi:hypothetical protein
MSSSKQSDKCGSEANGDLSGSNPDDCGFDSRLPYQTEGEMNKVPEWHVVYGEWAIHTPSGRVRHLVCKRDVKEFVRFKKVAKIGVLMKDTKEVKFLRDDSMHMRRKLLMQNQESIIHRCQGTDPYEEIEEIVVPTMVVEIAVCYMKV